MECALPVQNVNGSALLVNISGDPAPALIVLIVPTSACREAAVLAWVIMSAAVAQPDGSDNAVFHHHKPHHEFMLNSYARYRHGVN